METLQPSALSRTRSRCSSLQQGMRGTQATVGFHVPPLKTRPAAASAARSAAYCWKYGADIDWIKEPPPEGGHGFLLPVVDAGASVAVVFSAAAEDGVATSLASSAATHLEGVGATLAPCDEAGVEPAEVHEEAGDAVADSDAAHVAYAWCRRAARINRAGKQARATLSSGCSTGENIQR